MSGYKTRINKALAGLSIKADIRKMIKYNRGHYDEDGLYGNQEFRIDSAEYSVRGECCELCGHNPIKRIFILENRSNGKKTRIGSECAKNYADADLVDGMAKLLDEEYLRRTNPIKFEKEVEILNKILEDRAYFYSCRAALSRYVGRFINNGDPRAVLRKIEAGKRIGKREKQVIGYYALALENRDVFLALEGLNKFVAKYGESKWEREYRLLETKRKYQAANRNLAIALNDIGFLVANAVGDFLVAAAAPVVVEEVAPVAVNVDDIDSLIKLAPKGNKFVNSIANQYKRKGFLSQNQINSLKGNIAMTENAELVLKPLFESTPAGAKGDFFESLRSFYLTKGYLTFKQALAISKFF